MCSEHLLSNNNDILPFSFQQWNESEWWKKVFYLQQGGEIIKILCCVALVYNSFFFFRTGVFKRTLFDIRFSYKRCNFSRGCLLVKMASKTVTRSIRPSNRPVVYWSKKKIKIKLQRLSHLSKRKRVTARKDPNFNETDGFVKKFRLQQKEIWGEKTILIRFLPVNLPINF